VPEHHTVSLPAGSLRDSCYYLVDYAMGQFPGEARENAGGNSRDDCLPVQSRRGPYRLNGKAAGLLGGVTLCL
jgi:hypothetical protein